MNRQKFNADQGRLWLAAVVLVGLLLLLRPAGAPLGLTLVLVGAFIWFYAVFHAFAVLLDVLLQVLRRALSLPEEATPSRRWVRWRSALAFLLAILLGAAAVVVSQSAALARPPFAEALLQLGLALVILAILAEWMFARPGAAGPPAVSPPPEAAVTAVVAAAEPGLPRDPVLQVVDWFVLVVRALWNVLEALLMMFVKTATTILPTSARLVDLDKKYNQENQEEMERIVTGLKLPPTQHEIMVSYWIKQIIWISGRANRERDANELIRWWQIILSASIPVIGVLPFEGDKTLPASLAGAVLTILTAMQQFRRPEERWHHYRKLAERMQWEFWSFVNLDEGIYQPARAKAQDVRQVSEDEEVRSAAFQIFNDRMIKLREEDMQVFFSQVTPLTQPVQPQGAMPPKPGAASPDQAAGG